MKPNQLIINQITTNNQALTMSSLEISELVQSRHDSVKRTIETLVNQGVIAYPQTVDVQEVKGNNRTYTTQAYLFIGEQGKLDSITVVAQLCPQFTAKLVKRWYELEQSTTITDPLLLIAHMATQAYEAKQLALKQEQRLCHIEQKVDVAIAKAQAVLDDDGYFSIKGFCSLHGIKLTNSQMSSLSKKCKKLSDVKDIPYQETTDPRWGKVKTYHREILAEVFRIGGYLLDVPTHNT